MKLTREMAEDAARMLADGVTLTEAARTLGVTAKSLRRALARYGVRTPTSGDRRRARMETTRRLCAEGLCVSEISRVSGFAKSTVRGHLRLLGLKAVKVKTGVRGARRARKLTPGRLAEAARMRAGGATFVDIARRFGVTPQTVRIAMRVEGIAVESPARWQKTTDATLARTIDLLERGMDSARIARTLGVTVRKVWYLARCLRNDPALLGRARSFLDAERAADEARRQERERELRELRRRARAERARIVAADDDETASIRFVAAALSGQMRSCPPAPPKGNRLEKDVAEGYRQLARAVLKSCAEEMQSIETGTPWRPQNMKSMVCCRAFLASGWCREVIEPLAFGEFRESEEHGAARSGGSVSGGGWR